MAETALLFYGMIAIVYLNFWLILRAFYGGKGRRKRVVSEASGDGKQQVGSEVDDRVSVLRRSMEDGFKAEREERVRLGNRLEDKMDAHFTQICQLLFERSGTAPRAFSEASSDGKQQLVSEVSSDDRQADFEVKGDAKQAVLKVDDKVSELRRSMTKGLRAEREERERLGNRLEDKMDAHFLLVCQWLFERSGAALPARLVDDRPSRAVGTVAPPVSADERQAS